MGNLLTFDFWINYYYVPLTPVFKIGLIVVTALFVVSAIIFGILKKRKNIYTGLCKNIFDFSLTNAIIGIAFLFFYYEHTPFFTARIWLALWFIEIVLWLINIFKQWRRVNKQSPELSQKQNYNKYLPK